MIDFILKIPSEVQAEGLQDLFVKRPPETISFSDTCQELVLWGDPVGGKDFADKAEGIITPEQIFSRVSGHYYFVLLNKKEREIIAGNSVFSILPVYYHMTGSAVVLSNNAIDLGKDLGLSAISRRFILETMLFNYPLFNNSIIEGISLLPSNSYMRIRQGNFTIVKHTHFEEYFSSDPVPWRSAADTLSDAFVETVKRYLPPGRYVSALTGGFDSRTLLAAGLASGGDMLCYSFGAPGSKDVEIPAKVTSEVGLPYVKMLLDDDYARDESLKNGIEFILNASGSASFSRGHYLYAARAMAGYSGYMITGNFGSELFRAANVRGVVFSPNLTALFSSRDPDEALELIRNSPQFRTLRPGGFEAEWEQLRQDLPALPCFDKAFRHLTQNQKFYLYVFEEVFRKYFGAEMSSQFRYLRNRTPYIDSGFLKAILGTGFAGVYSGFFERNPFKRYKGQVLYAHIIRKTRPDLGRIITDKGYCTEDLLTLPGRMRVVRGWVKKKTNNVNKHPDPYSVELAFRHNSDFYRQVPIDFELFSPGYLTGDSFLHPDGNLIMMLSISLARAAVEGRDFPVGFND